MAGKNSYFRRNTLTFGQQMYVMARLFPVYQASLGKDRLSFTGDVAPFGCADTYRVRIDYEMRSRPSVWVLTPHLRSTGEGIKIPHTFSDGSLCLHTPGQWQSDMTIAEYIVPCIAQWLFYYEAWLATGEWLGGGAEHQRKIKK
jgi:hypothetical protein